MKYRYRFLAFFSGFRRYGVRSFPTVADASIGPIAVNADEEKQFELRRQLNRELNDLNKKIGNIERQLQGLLSAPEKEDFRAVEVRVDLARKYIGKGISKAKAETYAQAIARRKEIEENRPAEIDEALIIKEIGPKPRETFVLIYARSQI